MRLEWELAVRGYRRYAAYPAATWAGILTNTVFGFIQAYVLLALFETRDDIGGYDATDTLTYVWLRRRCSRGRDLRRPTLLSGSSAAMWPRISSGPCIPSAQASPSLGRALFHALFRGLPPPRGWRQSCST